MKAKNLINVPWDNKREYSYGDNTELDSYDLERLYALNPEFVIYTYSAGGYEGSGNMILKIEGKGWFEHDMGHCSCYGPVEQIEIQGKGAATVNDLYYSCSKAKQEELAPLMKKIPVRYRKQEATKEPTDDSKQ